MAASCAAALQRLRGGRDAFPLAGLRAPVPAPASRFLTDGHRQQKQDQHGTFLKWRLVIAYDGTDFSGWQYQPDFPSVQGLVEDALTRLTRYSREELVLIAASRTDAGVHAVGQVAHFHSRNCIGDLGRIHRGMNGTLPYQVRVSEISAVQTGFHAQFSARTKKYEYKLYMAPVMDPFLRFYAYHVPEKLDVAAMREACKYFVGEHDFTTFSNCSVQSRLRLQRNPVRKILYFNLVEEGPVLSFEIEGTGFFHKQIRNMIGLIITIGKGHHVPWTVPELLALRDRQALANFAITAPSRGLTLVSVNYDVKELAPPEGAPPASFGTF